jgi:hypothetical protein
MASVRRIPAGTEMKVVEITPETFVLNLSRDEADKLHALMGKCSFKHTVAGLYEGLSQSGASGHKYTVTTVSNTIHIHLDDGSSL